MRLLFLFCLLAALTVPASPASADVVTVKKTKDFAYQVYLPSSYTPDRAWPVVVLFHWSTARSSNMIKVWRETAERHGIVLAAPNSHYRMRWTQRDAANVMDMLVDVTVAYNIDSKRIFAAGFSSGANFSYRMMLTNPGLFRAVGPFAGRMAAKDVELTDTRGQENTRVCIFHGTADPRIRFHNAEVAARRLVLNGFEVHSTVYRGHTHWIPKKHAEQMWRCLSGGGEGRDT